MSNNVLDDVKKYSHLLVASAEYNKLRKCALDLHLLKKKVKAGNAGEQRGGGGGGNACSWCQTGEEAPSASSSDAAPDFSRSEALALKAAARLVLDSLTRQESQDGCGSKDKLVEANRQQAEAVVQRASQNDLITPPPLSNTDTADLVTPPPLSNTDKADLVTRSPPLRNAVGEGDRESAASKSIATTTKELDVDTVVNKMAGNKRKAAKVLVMSIFRHQHVSIPPDGGIRLGDWLYSNGEFTHLISLSFRKIASVRVRGKDNFFHFLSRTGLLHLVQNKKIREKYTASGVSPPGANGAGALSAPLTPGEKNLIDSGGWSKWWTDD